jgi:hypothetical protein
MLVLYTNHAILPIDISPFKAEEFAEPHSCAEPAEHKRIPARKVLTGRLRELVSVNGGERVDVRLSLVSRLQVVPHVEGRVAVDLAFVRRLCQDRAQGPDYTGPSEF